jgi:sec-independent protein translocase protein TatB
VFGLSFSELLVIAVVALVAVGPEKLPGMLRTLGEWIRKMRNLTYEVRAQSGIDEILRAEGLHGGINELKSLVRSARQPFLEPLITAPLAPSPPPSGAASPFGADPSGQLDPSRAPPRYEDPYANLEVDATREYPPEGPDAYGALPDDLVDPDAGDVLARVDVLSAAQPLPEPQAEPPGPEPRALAPATGTAAPVARSATVEANGVAPAPTDSLPPVAEEAPHLPSVPQSAESPTPAHRDLNLPPASS